MTLFLINALGFFIQLFPCALMIFLPFPKEAYRFKRKHIFTWMAIIAAVSAVLFALLICARDTEKYPRYAVISNLFMLAAVLLILSAYILLVRESLLKKALVFFIVLFYAVTEFVTVNVIHPILHADMTDAMVYPYTAEFLLLYAVVTVLLLPLMLTVVIRPLREYIERLETKNMRREFTITIISTLAYFILTIYCDTVYGKAGFFRQHLPLLLFLTANQMLIYWLIFKESVRRSLDGEQRRAMEIQQLQYENIVRDMESTRRMRHDLHYHYSSLNDMLDRGRTDEIRDYLSKIIDTTVKRDNEMYCKNMTVNGLLQYYIGLARDAGIRCEAQAECGELDIEPADLTVLFGNAMENAVNACRKCPDDMWISVRVGTVHDSLAIEISNSCGGVKLTHRFKTKDGFLPAEAFLSDRTGGGYGLRSIARTARKYGGSAMFRFDAGQGAFTARIRLNTRAEEKLRIPEMEKKMGR